MGPSIKEIEISPLDRHFARFVSAFADGEAGVFMAAALVSMATRQGHSCLELQEWAGDEVSFSGQIWVVPELAQWREVLGGCPAVATGSGKTPLVMEDNRLYLRRYWEYEEEVAQGFLRRGGAACLTVDDRLLAAGLARYFLAGSGVDNDGQSLAALVAVLRPLAVITGGPGTGKTTTVALILALLAEQYPEPRKRLRVALAAPTGKAAMRLQESISRVKKSWLFQGLGAGAPFPEQVMTIHRLLGVIGGTASFRHDEKNPLPYDLVVVDEASMVDLPMMAKLFRALQPETRLVLLGDRHQLASVEPGSVLGDLCHPAALALFSKEFCGRLGEFGISTASGAASGMTFGLADSSVELRRSHRFASESGIGRLGAAVKCGDVGGAWEVLADPAAPDVVWREVSSPDHFEIMLAELIPNWFAGLQHMTPAEALAANERFRVLCALRQGPFGAEQVNARLERLLQTRGYQLPAGRNYPGRPVMVLSNDYDQQLYNGDVGIIFPDPDQAGELKAFFPGPDGGLRKLSPARLPPHQTVYAMTVHKSQGSEFERVLLVLPDYHSPLISRELLFTAITRARDQVEIWGSREVFEQALLVSAERHSGLREKLWRDLPDASSR